MTRTLNYDDLEGSKAEIKEVNRNLDGEPIAVVLEVDGEEIYIGSMIDYQHGENFSILDISYNC